MADVVQMKEGLWLAADFFGSVAGVFFWSYTTEFRDFFSKVADLFPKVADSWYKI